MMHRWELDRSAWRKKIKNRKFKIQKKNWLWSFFWTYLKYKLEQPEILTESWPTKSPKNPQILWTKMQHFHAKMTFDKSQHLPIVVSCNSCTYDTPKTIYLSNIWNFGYFRTKNFDLSQASGYVFRFWLSFSQFSTYLMGYSISPLGLRSTSNSSSGLLAASSNDIFGRFLNSRTLFGCELSFAPIIVIPLSLILPVNGMLNRSSSSASLSTNCQQNQ